MTTARTGSEQVLDLLIENNLIQVKAEQAIEPIAQLLDQLIAHTWTLADEQQLTARTQQFKQVINESIAVVNCDEILWVSLRRSFQPQRINWLNPDEYSELWDKQAELISDLLYRRIDIPAFFLTWSTDLSTVSSTLMQDIDGLWGDLTALLPQHIDVCVTQELEKATEWQINDDLTEVFVLALFQPIQHYLTMRFIDDNTNADRLLPLLKALTEGVVPLGTAKTTAINQTLWLLSIA